MTAPENPPAAAVQVGGRHYKDFAIQPLQYVAANGLGPFEAAVIKYVTRWQAKGGIEDLRKARHYIDWLVELANEYDYPQPMSPEMAARMVEGVQPVHRKGRVDLDPHAGVLSVEDLGDTHLVPESTESGLALLKRAQESAAEMEKLVTDALASISHIAPITDAQMTMQTSVRAAHREAVWARQYLVTAIQTLEENPGHE